MDSLTEKAFTYLGAVILAVLLASYVGHTVTQMQAALAARFHATVAEMVRR
jgi:uncharacterized protein involved in cysteine biosynthesis